MAKIKVDGWQNAYDRIVSAKYLKSLNYEEQTKRYIDSFDEYEDLVLVAVKDSEVLGYACFNKNYVDDKYDSELVSLYIKPGYINQGIGTSLFRETVKTLNESGKKNMIVWCLTNNDKAIRFYEKMGGKQVEEKNALIGNEFYTEYGFYFNLEEFISGLLS